MSLESMLKAFISKTETQMSTQQAHIQSQGVTLRNLENQMGQLASALSSRPSGSLPSNTVIPKPNKKEHCKAIQLRSGKDTASSERKQDGQVLEKENRAGDKETEVSPEISPVIAAPVTETKTPKLLTGRSPPPFPQRLKKTNHEKQFGKFLEILKQLHINIPLVEAFEQMPNRIEVVVEQLSV